MVESRREAWHEIVHQAEDAGADGLELNFGCPHGMSERGMGSAVGQVPEYTQMITEWVMEAARTPVLVKLTPNISDIRVIARAARRGGALAAFRDQHDQLDHRHRSRHAPRPCPNVGGYSTHGGYCGPAVKPIALNMAQQIANDAQVQLPVSGIGGVAGWRDAAEFILLGCGTVQVCTAAMHYGFRIVEDMIDGLGNWMREKGFATIEDFRGRSGPKVVEWKNLDLNYKIVAQIHPEKCIGCDLCYTACWDGAHQCIHLPEQVRGGVTVTPIPKLDAGATIDHSKTPPARIPRVDESECVGCNLCALVCPVDGCITMERVENGLPFRKLGAARGSQLVTESRP